MLREMHVRIEHLTGKVGIGILLIIQYAPEANLTTWVPASQRDSNALSLLLYSLLLYSNFICSLLLCSLPAFAFRTHKFDLLPLLLPAENVDEISRQ